jgi:hypothetical protein
LHYAHERYTHSRLYAGHPPIVLPPPVEPAADAAALAGRDDA